MRLTKSATMIALIGAAAPAFAQQAQADKRIPRVEITGSSIKRIATEGALPVQTITPDQIDKQGITNAEQLMRLISANGTGADNMTSGNNVFGADADRVSGGGSFASLRGLGPTGTLVLINGRRISGYGPSLARPKNRSASCSWNAVRPAYGASSSRSSRGEVLVARAPGRARPAVSGSATRLLAEHRSTAVARSGDVGRDPRPRHRDSQISHRSDPAPVSGAERMTAREHLEQDHAGAREPPIEVDVALRHCSGDMYGRVPNRAFACQRYVAHVGARSATTLLTPSVRSELRPSRCRSLGP